MNSEHSWMDSARRENVPDSNEVQMLSQEAGIHSQEKNTMHEEGICFPMWGRCAALGKQTSPAYHRVVKWCHHEGGNKQEESGTAAHPHHIEHLSCRQAQSLYALVRPCISLTMFDAEP